MAPRKFTLYWSNLETYEACPQKFLWGRGWADMDVGGGPGRKRPPPIKESRHHAIMGQVIQKVIEDLYNNEMWRTPAGLADLLLEMVMKELNYALAKEYVDWMKAPPKIEMQEICRSAISGYLRTMKANKFLGPYARAEVELVGAVDPMTAVAGRADLIIRRDDTGVTILDGKNSKTKGKYTDPDQLRWYALLFYLVYGKLPERLGFVYYRYPQDPVTGDSGVDWVDFTQADVEGLAARAVSVRKAMEDRKFEPTPKPPTCQFCVYESVCEARKTQKAANAQKRNKNKGTQDFEDGFVDLKF